MIGTLMSSANEIDVKVLVRIENLQNERLQIAVSLVAERRGFVLNFFLVF